jgi:hypothetical protein
MVITYVRAEGQPQFSGLVRKWDLSVNIPDSVFSFTPPEGAAKIAFMPRRPGSEVGALDANAGKP